MLLSIEPRQIAKKGVWHILSLVSKAEALAHTKPAQRLGAAEEPGEPDGHESSGTREATAESCHRGPCQCGIRNLKAPADAR